jgi:TIR domain
MGPDRTTIFVSYCRKNSRWLERLKVHLKPYDRRGDLDLWDDTRIDPGDRWRSAISDAIDHAAASIVLISADFLASDFVAVHELPRLLHRAERDGARILPIFVEPCGLENHPQLASFQALNSPSRALAETTRVDAERVLVQAVKAIGDILARRSPPQENIGALPTTGARPVDSALFDELQTATITLSLLWALAQKEGSYTLSELEKSLSLRSRKRAYEALDRLLTSSWVEKVRISGMTKYRLTQAGIRQFRRLAAASDGPVRRAIVTS